MPKKKKQENISTPDELICPGTPWGKNEEFFVSELRLDLIWINDKKQAVRMVRGALKGYKLVQFACGTMVMKDPAPDKYLTIDKPDGADPVLKQACRRYTRIDGHRTGYIFIELRLNLLNEELEDEFEATIATLREAMEATETKEESQIPKT